MRSTARKLAVVTGALTALAAAALSIQPASADTFPGNAASSATDIVSAGSITTQNVIESYAADYNATAPAIKWADFCGTAGAAANGCSSTVDPAATVNTLKPGAGCAALIRPSGSGAGIAALRNASACVDVARSSSAPPSTACTTSLAFCVAYFAFGRDAVAWGSFDPAVPTVLTPAALKNIYNGTFTNWNQVPVADGGNGYNQAIKAVLPQAASGTRAFFLAAIGNPTIAGSVLQPATSVENDGTSIRTVASCAAAPAACLGVVSPYSAADYIAQRNAPAGVTDVRAGFTLRSLKGTATTTTPCTGSTDCSGAGQTLNISYGSGVPAGSGPFVRTVYNVVRASNTGVVDAKYTTLFSSSAAGGYICTHTSKLATYGFAGAIACGARTLVG